MTNTTPMPGSGAGAHQQPQHGWPQKLLSTLNAALFYLTKGVLIWVSGVFAAAGVVCFNTGLRLIVSEDDYTPLSWPELRVEALACIALSFFVGTLGGIIYYLVKTSKESAQSTGRRKATLLAFVLTVSISAAGSFVGYFSEELNASLIGRIRSYTGWWTPTVIVVLGVICFLIAKAILPNFWASVLNAVRRAVMDHFTASPAVAPSNPHPSATQPESTTSQPTGGTASIP